MLATGPSSSRGDSTRGRNPSRARIGGKILRRQNAPFDGGERDHERYRARVITRILTQFEDFPAEELDYMLTKLGSALTVAA